MKVPTCKILCGDSAEILATLPDSSVQCCVTSPPYWGLRNYGHEDQIGQEETPEQFVANLVSVFSAVRRVLKPDGSLWLNLGDSYAGSGKGVHQKQSRVPNGIKSKDLIGIPWMVAFALRADGWYLRSDIIWAKPNCMPESVTDRPTRSHEYLFLLTKNSRYYYDQEAIKEPCVYDVDETGTASRKAQTSELNGVKPGGFKDAGQFNGKHAEKQRGHSRRHAGFNDRWDKIEQCTGMRNKRDVWAVAPATYAGAHFATFPPALIRPCILAGTQPQDTVLDPFAGSGTTGAVSIDLGRSAVLIELNPDYIALIRERINITPGLF